jgi:hypothetical protein
VSIVLDKSTHSYTVDGRRAPGIHNILGAAGLLGEMPDREDILARGQRVHTAIEYDIKWQGDFYIDDLPEEERGYVYAARFARNSLPLDIQPDDVERLVCNRRLWYATQIDAIANTFRGIAIINWKTGGNYPYYAIQSAAEALCFGGFPVRRMTITLHSDGSFGFTEHKKEEDFKIWEAACDIYNWKMKQGGGVRPRQAKPDEPDTEPVENSTLFALPDQPREPEGIF